MNTIIKFLVVLVLIIPSLAHAAGFTPARIRHMEGDVYIKAEDDDSWLVAAINTPLDEGDSIWCPPGGRAEIQLFDGTIVRADNGSVLELIETSDRFSHIYLSQGRVFVHTRSTLEQGDVQIDADDTTVIPSGQTRLRLDMLPNGEEDVSILMGAAYVEGNGERTRVRAGQQLALEEGRSELMALNPPDQWEEWNRERDRNMRQVAQSRSYLPEELEPYSSDLEGHGSWVNDHRYGWVWRPTFTLGAGWAPYRQGRWAWKRGDYVWISYEPWGWVPYHYGRWAHITGRGWCWVPPQRGDVYWGPGYVGWYDRDDNIGWIPLAPGEVYFGYGLFGSFSVNLSIGSPRPHKPSYRNYRAPGAVTVIRRNDFLKGKITPRAFDRNQRHSTAGFTTGRPTLRPLPETRVPGPRPKNPKVAPPPVTPAPAKELRNRFPKVSPLPRRSEIRKHEESPPVQPTHRPEQRIPQSIPVKQIPQHPVQAENPAIKQPVSIPPTAVPAPAGGKRMVHPVPEIPSKPATAPLRRAPVPAPASTSESRVPHQPPTLPQQPALSQPSVKSPQSPAANVPISRSQPTPPVRESKPTSTPAVSQDAPVVKQEKKRVGGITRRGEETDTPAAERSEPRKVWRVGEPEQRRSR